MRILLLKTQAIGDLLMTTPAVHALHDLFPNATMVGLCGESSAEVYRRNPFLDDLLTFSEAGGIAGKAGEMFQLLRRIRSMQFDMSFAFQPSLRVHFIPWLARIPVRYGFAGANARLLNHSVIWAPNRDRYVVEHYLDLARCAGWDGNTPRLDFPVLPEEQERAAGILQKKGIGDDEAVAAVFPGGGKNPVDCVPAKRWMPNAFAEAMRRIHESKGFCFLVMGAPSDIETCGRVTELAGTCAHNLAGTTTLGETAALLERCSLALTNDSAPSHLAAALGIPSVVVFGPSDSRSLLPVPGPHVAVCSNRDCAPCYANSRFPGCSDVRCMESVTVDEVVGCALRLLGSRGETADA